MLEILAKTSLALKSVHSQFSKTLPHITSNLMIKFHLFKLDNGSNLIGICR